MTDTEKAKRHYLTDRQQFEAMKLLDEHLKAVGEGFFAYSPGWSDQAIADAVPARVQNIVNLRQRAFGQLTKVITPGVDVHRLELMIAAHDQFVTDVAAILRGENGDGPAPEFYPQPYLVGAPKP